MPDNLTHIDLFAGIGGFSIASHRNGFKTVAFVEKEPYCQALIKLRFGAVVADPKCDGCEDRHKEARGTECQSEKGGVCESQGSGGECPVADTEVTGSRRDSRAMGETKVKSKCEDDGTIVDGSSKDGPHLYSDIRDFDGTKYAGATLITGGFPCQPYSAAGKRKGNRDDRALWGEMFRIIKEVRPTWIIGENVSGITSMVEYAEDTYLEDKTYPTREDAEADTQGREERTGRGVLEIILGNLEEIGYEVQVFAVPACGLNAPHKRERIWIVAYNKCVNRGSIEQRHEEPKGETIGQPIKDGDSNAPNPNKLRPQEQRTEQQAGGDRPDDKDVADSEIKGLEGGNTEGSGCTGGRTTEHQIGRAHV